MRGSIGISVYRYAAAAAVRGVVVVVAVVSVVAVQDHFTFFTKPRKQIQSDHSPPPLLIFEKNKIFETFCFSFVTIFQLVVK